jgi:hypothetical protein
MGSKDAIVTVAFVLSTSTAFAATNVAAGKIATSTGAITNGSYITDGNKASANFASPPNAGVAWIQIDLGQSYSLGQVNLWHYFADGRTYHDVIVKLSTTADFSSGVTTVFNNDTNNSAGVGTGTHAEYAETSAGKTITFGAVTARYVKLWTNGSTANTYNHYVEVEVWTATTPTATATATAAPTATATATRAATATATTAPATNLAPSGSAFGWSGMTASTANTGKVSQSGLNDNNLTADVSISATGDAVNAWEAAGVTWASGQSISSVKVINGTVTAGGDGFLEANAKLQFSTDGTTWADSGWTISPAYPYSSAAGGQTYTFTGTAVSGKKGARVVGQVRTVGNSYRWIVKEVQVMGVGGATPTATATVGGTATPTPTTSVLGAKLVGGYLTTWEPRSTLRYIADNTDYNLIYVAFAIGYNTSTGTLRLDPLPGTSTPAQVKSEIQYANSKGKRVIVSVGGYCDFGSPNNVCTWGYNLSTTQKVDEFMVSIRDLRTNWGFNGMDWDLEHGERSDMAGIIDATKRMRTEFGNDWIIACAPGPNLSSWLTNWGPSIDSWAASQGVQSFQLFGEQIYDLGLSESAYQSTIVTRMTDVANRFGASRAMLGNKYKAETGTSLDDPNNTMVDISTTLAALAELRGAGKNIRGSYLWSIQSDSDLSYLWQSTNGVGGDILAHP